MKDNLDELFDEKKLSKAIKKSKLKSTIRTAIISLIVTIILIPLGSYFNTKISLKMSEQAFKDNEEIVKLTVPNGFISESIDNIGFLGGNGTYKVSRAVGYKPVVLRESKSIFGFSPDNPILKYLNFYPNYPYSRVQGGYAIQKNEDGWYVNYSENGYRRMMFFHPEVSYKGYKDDLNQLDKISDDQLIELAVSFDKPYKYYEAESLLSKVDQSWYWLDAFTKDDMKEYRKMAELHSGVGAYVSEYNAIGVNVNPQHFETGYKDLMDLLKDTKLEKYKAIYKEMMAKGYKEDVDVPVLGAIVYGTKSELKVLIGNPAIKASSFGIIINKY